jgi:hypothetical protein
MRLECNVRNSTFFESVPLGLPFLVGALIPRGGLSERREDADTFTTRFDAQAGMAQVNRAEFPPELAPVVFHIVDDGVRHG